MPYKLAGAVIGLALLAWPGMAAAGSYDGLSLEDRAHVDALYLAQQQPAGLQTLSRDEIAARRGPAGWNGVFEDLKGRGYYPHDRSFADVQRALYRPPSASAKAQAAQAANKAARRGGLKGAKAAKAAAKAPVPMPAK
jgi:hypothetical protein